MALESYCFLNQNYPCTNIKTRNVLLPTLHPWKFTLHHLFKSIPTNDTQILSPRASYCFLHQNCPCTNNYAHNALLLTVFTHLNILLLSPLQTHSCNGTRIRPLCFHIQSLAGNHQSVTSTRFHLHSTVCQWSR